MPKPEEVYKVVRPVWEKGSVQYFSAWVLNPSPLRLEYFTGRYTSAGTGLVFAFETFRQASDWKDVAGFNTEVWLARACGVRPTPHTIPKVLNAFWRDNTELAAFWAQALQGRGTSIFVPHSQTSITGSILCKRLKLVRKVGDGEEEDAN